MPHAGTVGQSIALGTHWPLVQRTDVFGQSPMSAHPAADLAHEPSKHLNSPGPHIRSNGAAHMSSSSTHAPAAQRNGVVYGQGSAGSATQNGSCSFAAS